MRIRRGRSRGKINACWKDAEEVRNLWCLSVPPLFLSFTVMTSLSVIKGALEGNKCLSITGVLIVSGARPVLQPHFPMFKAKIWIGEVRLGGAWLPNMHGTLWKSHSFQPSGDLPAVLFLLLGAWQLLPSLSHAGCPDTLCICLCFYQLASSFCKGGLCNIWGKKQVLYQVWHQRISANRLNVTLFNRTTLGKTTGLGECKFRNYKRCERKER